MPGRNDPETLRAWDEHHAWHAYTQMQEYLALPPLHVLKGRGCWLTDTEGRRYLDANASIWTNVHGHGDPELNAALVEQLSKCAHSTWLGLSHPVGLELSRRLVELAPTNLTRAYFSDNGSTAVEVALKLSFQYWQLTGQPGRTEVVAMQGAYHGDTFGTMSVGDSGTFHERFRPWMFPVHRFPAPVCHECGGEVSEQDSTASLAALERILTERAGRIACVLLEPWVQGAAGMKLQPRRFVRAVQDLCRANGCHLILDEVFVGFGRLGPMVVSREAGVQPDLLCLAKGLTAGYLPLAATLATEEIYEAFLGPYESFKTFFHGHTFTANPLAAAVALESIRKLDTLITSGQLARGITKFGELLRRHALGHPHVREVRQRGFAAAIDLCPAGKPAESFPVSMRFGLRCCLEARELSLLLRPLGDSLLLVPPLVISETELEFLVTQTLEAVNRAARNFIK